ncbi:S66 family peptidase [Streptomyces mobaraensis]|uniref:LD-carboxypeptidase n=1 Tax=Streptomyces mobaraensis TaxID=35621 RepID=A0A5N5VX48_STRMB|nr:S66 peptidase family protein [Streptomyces mobaraensis]KAB7833097.1 LD-carboxypeptidase [Streptomyces mobaraensis]
MRPHPPFTYPSKPRPGDRVAVVSPSSGLPGLLPLPFELGLRRLREEFGLVPVEYPTTRKMGASPRERADDLHAAFADPDITAVFSSIGGDDQLTVLPHLDRDLVRAHPKPFFGYSDNTNLHAWLWNSGIVSYHGASVMVELGRPGALHPVTAASLRAALFTSGPYELVEAREFNEIDRPWDDPETFLSPPPTRPCQGWTWRNPDRVVEGVSWGGNIEILSWLLMADREIREPSAYDGCVFFLETSEEQPRPADVYGILRSLGERGILRRFPAVLVGRAKGWSLDRRRSPEEADGYRQALRTAVGRALDEYAPDVPAVFDVDLGHTDPQQVIPYGGTVRVDGPARRITVTY